jgi:hypothetical protein
MEHDRKTTSAPRFDPSLAIQKAGGVRAAAAITGFTRQAVYRWLSAAKSNSAKGAMPVSAQESLLRSGRGIGPDDFWRHEGEANVEEERQAGRG